MRDEKGYFTVCFEGDIRAIKGNPFDVKSDFGKVVVIGLGDAFAEADELRQEIEKLGGTTP